MYSAVVDPQPAGARWLPCSLPDGSPAVLLRSGEMLWVEGGRVFIGQGGIDRSPIVGQEELLALRAVLSRAKDGTVSGEWTKTSR